MRKGAPTVDEVPLSPALLTLAASSILHSTPSHYQPETEIRTATVNPFLIQGGMKFKRNLPNNLTVPW